MELKASGMAATARATANIRASSTGSLRYRLMANTKAHMAVIPKARRPENRSRLSWRGVFFSLASLSREAIRPISVSIPVAVTTAAARPEVTRALANTIFTRSPTGTECPSLSRRRSARFSTFKDSPVRELSFTVRPYTSKSLPSAGIRSPVSRSRISPGTTSAEGTATARPSRITRASGDESRRRLSRDFSALWC